MTLPRKPARYWSDGDFNALADAIEGVDNSLPITYSQPEAPVAPITDGSVWIDSDDGYRAYVWSGSAWISLEGPAGEQGPPGLDGIDGDDGLPGPAGTSSYTHIAYANLDVSPWTGFSTSDSTNKLYVGMFVDDVEADSQTPSDYHWTLIKGMDGANGIPGDPGDDGQTPYFHVAYATSADGTAGFSTTVATGKTYIGTFTDFVQADSQTPGDYRWVKFEGPQGPAGADGSDGADGAAGARGAGFYHATSALASAPDAGTFTTLADGATPGGNVFQDRVTVFNNGATPPWSVTKFWDGSQWLALTQYVDGNLLVTGTVAGSKIIAGTLSADRLDANGISANQITTGTLNAARISGGSITADKLQTWGIMAGSLTGLWGTLALAGSPGGIQAYAGVGFDNVTPPFRTSMNGSYGIRIFLKRAMTGADYPVSVQSLGNGSAVRYYLPRVVDRQLTYFDLMFVDPATYLWTDPYTFGDASKWMIQAIDVGTSL